MKDLALKNKKLIIIFGIVFGLITLLVILHFTLFSLKTVEVDFKTENHVFSTEAIHGIKGDSSINKGGSIFGVNKKEITNSLESNNAYLKVINIETVFPNKIVIHCAEREETYAVKTKDHKYFICDSEFKVLYITYSYSTSNQTNPILLKGLENLIENEYSANAGDFLKFSAEGEILKSIGQNLLKANKTVAMQKALIKSIELTSGIYYYTAQNQPYLVVEDFNGFKTNIYALNTLLDKKFEAMFLTLSQVVYDPEVFFKDEIEDGELTLQTVPNNYYLNYVLDILEDNNSKLQIKLKKVA